MSLMGSASWLAVEIKASGASMAKYAAPQHRRVEVSKFVNYITYSGRCSVLRACIAGCHETQSRR
jgi:hypothetical protein